MTASLLETLVGLLPPSLRPYAKSVYPFVLNIGYAVVAIISTGTYDAQNLAVNLAGLVGVLLTFLVPNKPKAVK